MYAHSRELNALSLKTHSHLFMPGFDVCSWRTLMFVAENNMTNINQRISPDSGHLIFTKEILGDNCYPPSVQGGHHTARVRRGEETT